MRFGGKSLYVDEHGTTAVEFAIIAPIFIALVVGLLYLCMGLFVIGSLHYAVEEGARCASVRTAVCKDSSTIISYATSRYFGPTSQPNFSYQSASCGNAVTGSINYQLSFLFGQVTIPFSATACFP